MIMYFYCDYYLIIMLIVPIDAHVCESATVFKRRNIKKFN